MKSTRFNARFSSRACTHLRPYFLTYLLNSLFSQIALPLTKKTPLRCTTAARCPSAAAYNCRPRNYTRGYRCESNYMCACDPYRVGPRGISNNYCPSYFFSFSFSRLVLLPSFGLSASHLLSRVNVFFPLSLSLAFESSESCEALLLKSASFDIRETTSRKLMRADCRVCASPFPLVRGIACGDDSAVLSATSEENYLAYILPRSYTYLVCRGLTRSSLADERVLVPHALEPSPSLPPGILLVLARSFSSIRSIIARNEYIILH